WEHVLFGSDPTEGIVSVDADTAGRARVWRRAGSLTQLSEHRFPNWFLATNLDLLAHLPAEYLDAAWLRTTHGRVSPGAPLAVVELDTPLAITADVYRYLVLTRNLADVETALVET